MKQKTWNMSNSLSQPVAGENVVFQDSPLEKPDGVDEIIRANWDDQLTEKQEELSEEGITTEIRPYHDDPSLEPLNALYEDGQVRMWPGPVVSLKDVSITSRKIILKVGQTSFPFIAGLDDWKVSYLYEDQGIKKPSPALAICTYAITADGKLTLTVRGPRTNMYPGRLYGQGGNPLYTNTVVVNHQIGEMADEINVQPEDYDTDDFLFTGIVVDKEDLPNKPDLVGYIPINLEEGDVRERVKKRKSIPNDAVGVEFAPTGEVDLFDYLVRMDTKQFCPPAYAGLVLYGAARHGFQWYMDLMKKNGWLNSRF